MFETEAVAGELIIVKKVVLVYDIEEIISIEKELD